MSLGDSVTNAVLGNLMAQINQALNPSHADAACAGGKEGPSALPR